MTGLNTGVVFGLSSVLVGLILGVQAGNIRLTERLRWSFRSFRRGLSLSHHFHVLFPLVSAIFLFEWLSYWMAYALNIATGYGPVAGLTAAVALGLSVGLGYWLLSGLFP